MAYDQGLAERLRGVMSDEVGCVEKRMFGGLAFMLRGHMCVGVLDEDLVVRVPPDRHGELAREPHARSMDFTGRPMTGFLYVAAPGYEADVDLERWVGRAVAFVSGLPVKEPSASRKSGRGKTSRAKVPRAKTPRTKSRVRRAPARKRPRAKRR